MAPFEKLVRDFSLICFWVERNSDYTAKLLAMVVIAEIQEV